MHDTSESGVVNSAHPIDSYHIKKTDFKDKGYTTFNRLTWEIAGLVTLWYHGISCIEKDTSKYVYTEGTFTPQLMTGSTNGYFNEIGSREYYGNNEVENISSFVTSELLKPNSQDSLCELFVVDRTLDSKYYRKTQPLTVANGDVWESIMSVKFDKIT
mgnify:FL=1